MNNYSIATFGSLVRPDFDKYSDKDLLLVGKSFHDIKNIKQHYEGEGYSVSLYTYEKLKYLSANGSLFLDHLKKEAVVILDFENQLSDIITQHVPLVPSNEKIEEAIAYFNVLEIVPNTKLGFAWFCDCFYVGLRNFLILKSAQSGLYNFSFLKLLEEFVNSGTISINEQCVLRELRIIKRNYRAKQTDEFPDKSFINKIVLIGEKLDLLSKSVNFVNENEFSISIREKLNDKTLNHYLKLRLAEMYYYSLNLPTHSIEKIIFNPQMYASMFKDAKFIDELLQDLDKRTAHNIALSKCRRQNISFQLL